MHTIEFFDEHAGFHSEHGDSSGNCLQEYYADSPLSESADQSLIRVSVDSNAQEYQVNSREPRISANGRYAIFLKGFSTNQPDSRVMIRDLVTGITRDVGEVNGVLHDGPFVLTSGLHLPFNGVSDNGRVVFQTAAALVSGDTNGDHAVTIEDYFAIRDHFLEPVVHRVEGDLTDDGQVDFIDFQEWLDSFPGGAEAARAAIAAVPEPATSVLTGIICLWILLCARARSASELSVAVSPDSGPQNNKGTDQ